MTAAFLHRRELLRFSTLIAERLGLSFDGAKVDSLAPVLRERMAGTGTSSVESYLQRFDAPATAHDEVRALARRLTVGETYFFRNGGHFDALAAVVIPSLAQAAALRGGLRILSAGCASGEEPYSIAMWLCHRFPGMTSSARIHGVDVNTLAIKKAIGATYSSWSLRETSPDLRNRYFSENDGKHVVEARVRRLVSFDARNLADDDPELWSPTAYDVVFCRNVLMYFSPAAAAALVERITRALVPGGYLFLGHAESLRGLSGGYSLCQTHDTFYYRRGGSPEALSSVPTASAAAAREAVTPAGPLPAWMTAIEAASKRVEVLARGSSSPADVVATGEARSVVEEPAEETRSALDIATDLHREERFEDALARLRELPASSLAEPGALLLLALLLTNVGELSDAEQACERLLALDEQRAGAHYLMALCRERAGDPAAAMKHDRAAASVDPSFAMPRLHLGLLSKRARDFDTARTELREALSLLSREDDSRVVLFGGGFRRDALVELCRAELGAMAGLQ